MLATLDSSEEFFVMLIRNTQNSGNQTKKGVVLVLFCGMNFPELDFSDL